MIPKEIYNNALLETRYLVQYSKAEGDLLTASQIVALPKYKKKKIIMIDHISKSESHILSLTEERIINDAIGMGKMMEKMRGWL